ncbi:MAG: hypothetical protein VXW43_16975, partial [Pseudomonadota bacterium]|nr:hypothetical protein [Pseudomonadota bacterium]
EIGGRRDAIARAIAEAGEGDIVLVAGKGHEQGQIIGSGEKVSRFTEVIELIVLISDTASAPPFFAASAGRRMSVILGVSFTITGLS